MTDIFIFFLIFFFFFFFLVKRAGRHFGFFKRAGRHEKGAGGRALQKKPRQNTYLWQIMRRVVTCNVGCGVGLSPLASVIIIIFVLCKNQSNRVHCTVKQIVCEHSIIYL